MHAPVVLVPSQAPSSTPTSVAPTSTTSTEASTLFTVENIRRVLSQHKKGLEAREVCLYIQDKDPQLHKAASDDIKTVKRILYARADVGVRNPGEPKPVFYLTEYARLSM